MTPLAQAVTVSLKDLQEGKWVDRTLSDEHWRFGDGGAHGY